MNIRPDLTLIERIAAMLRDELGDDYDDDTFLDTLDGETDALDIADALIASMQDDEALAAATKEQADALAFRARRIGARAATKKRALLSVIDAIGVKKLERSRATVIRRNGSLSVQITDETAVPSQLCKVVRTPDKTAIKRQIEAGEDVPGATLARGPDGVTVRVR
ncbi:MAG: siphovirus Gp157 family protein [Rhodosalinus sp.]